MKVSVVAPVRNEEAALEALLESLLSQTHAPDEIVVADGGSTDRTVAVARRYSKKGVRVLEIGPAYPGRGRNEGIRAARNDWVALIDAGCVADPRWLEHLVSACVALGATPAAIFGDFSPILESGWDVAQALAFVGPFDPGTRCHPPIVPSSLIHREAWRMAGGFPEGFRAAEDLLFMESLGRTGVPVIRSPDAVVRWQLPPTPRAVFRRFRLYAAHHLAAGLSRTWHLRVMAMDVTAASLAVLSTVWTPSIAALLAASVTRLARTVARRRHNVPGGFLGGGRLLRVTWLLLVADAALWAGTMDYLSRREPRF